MVRRLKWIGSFILVLFVVLFGSGIWSKNASAFNIMYGGYAGLSASTTLYGNMGSLGFNTGFAGHINSTVQSNNPYGYATSLNICLNDTIPAGSIFTTNISFAGKNTAGNQIYPQIALNGNSYDYSVITNSYGEYGLTTSIFYTDIDISGCNLWLNPTVFSMTMTDIRIQPINWIRLTESGLSQSEKNTLFQHLNNISGADTNISNNTFNILNELQEIKDKMDAEADEREQEKQEQEQQGTQSNTDSDQAGQDVESATTNLLSAITGFFGAFTSASATTCQTDWGIEGFRNFDFCGTQVPTELRVVFTIVASIIFIPMIWFLITSILNAFKEFQQ